MRMTLRVLLLASAMMLLAPSMAHHSPAMLYDLSREVIIEGVVTEYQLGNPHMRVYLTVDNQGTEESWLAEGGSRTQLVRAGWTGEELKPGDKVIVRGHPARDAGSKLVHMEYLTLPDGTERFAEDVNYESFNDRRRRPR